MGMPARLPLIPSMVLAGAGLIIAGTFVPVNGGGDFGYRYAIFDRSLNQPTLLLVAVEPLAVAWAASLAAVVIARRAPALAAGLMIALGFQTLVFFLAYVGGAAFGDPAYDSFEPGGVLGALGAALVLTAGVSVAVRRQTV
jgi:hypothetical protein